MTRNEQKKSHHHGNLRAALIEAGLQLLEQGGPEALTLRRAAALAGVSHAAPAHHFDGISGLRAALAEEGFRRFRNYMVDAMVIGDQSPRGRVRSIGRGYFRFAQDNRALFDLMFGYDSTAEPKVGIRDIGHFGYQVLREACAPLVPAGEDPVIVETQVWSLIHGFTCLWLSGRFRASGQDGEEAMLGAVLAAYDRIGAG